ncbi:hypothetical protein H2198_007085 [Neophaeococcomyces mojaviensis]|uniref:Uncharacterized protein n=1 Tax=Neophaeococcomyces mojaviensis TaxID=3383035 RepID=A0ACC3A114_9EURO|nr:hypothetical protein H2198_007085 [Knufia sp. JES_112]
MSSTSQIYSAVSSHYSAASSGRTKSGSYESTVAKAFGYSEDELASIPQESNLGLSCGNPLALAALRPGETVLDLGSGAGFDVFLTSPKVGPTGQSIGVDMNKDMLARAERNKEKGGYTNVRFVEAPITDIKPVDSGSVDCVISNCVVNLVPEEEKHLVFKEMYRLLKPGGRVAISDILIKDGKELPDTLKQDMALYVGCIAGASLVGGYEKYLRDAGFSEILIVDNKKDLNVYNSDVNDGEEAKSCCGTSVPVKETTKSCCGTTVPVQQPTKSCCGTTSSSCGPTATDAKMNGAESDPATIKIDLKSVDFNTYAGSYNIYAVKA